MSNDAASDEFDRTLFCRAVQAGCDRSTACNVVGVSLEALAAAMEANAELRRQVLAAEAKAEVQHMTSILNASKDEKNWRTSAWWFDRRDALRASADKQQRQAPPALAAAAIEQLAELIAADVPEIERRCALVARLLDAAGAPREPDESPAALALPAPPAGEIRA
jgi:hypothetical protein